MANVWVESFWLTRRESVTIGDPDGGESITRDFSVGMTVKSDGSAKSDGMYKALDKALNVIIEEEKEKWMNSYLMDKERTKLKEKLKEKSRFKDECIKEDLEETDGERITSSESQQGPGEQQTTEANDGEQE